MPSIGRAPAAGPLPAGGASGQALVKTGSADNAIGWGTGAAGGGAAPIIRPGSWYDNRALPVNLAGSTSTSNLTYSPGFVYYYPFYNPATMSVNGLGAMLGSGASTGAITLVGLYGASGINPGALLCSAALPYNAGSNFASNPTVSVPSTTLPAGWNFIAVGCSTTSNGSTQVVAAPVTGFRQFYPFAPGTSQPLGPYQSATVLTSLASNPPLTAYGYGQYMPVVFFRAA